MFGIRQKIEDLKYDIEQMSEAIAKLYKWKASVDRVLNDLVKKYNTVPWWYSNLDDDIERIKKLAIYLLAKDSGCRIAYRNGIWVQAGKGDSERVVNILKDIGFKVYLVTKRDFDDMVESSKPFVVDGEDKDTGEVE